MKHIYRFGEKGYVHMDSYNENHETRFSSFVANTFVAVLVAAMSVMTACAFVGVDATKIFTAQPQQTR